MNRRDFLKVSSAGLLVLSRQPRGLTAEEGPKELPTRILGRTGYAVSILGFGGASIGLGMTRPNRKEAVAIVNRAIDLGITYIDTASSYGDSEEKIGEVMRTRRKEVVLATKTLKRSKQESAKEIRESLRRLRTDYLDIIQIHAVNDVATLEEVLREDGAVAAAEEAQKAGLARFIGITGHRQPEVIAEALKRYPFATCLIPLSAADHQLYDFESVVFPIAKERNVGVIGMKVLADGRMTANVPVYIRYTLSLTITTAIIGMRSLKEVEQNCAVARTHTPMTRKQVEDLLLATREKATTDVLWWKR